MWLITNQGYFSAVQKRGKDHVTVRSRVKRDLERFTRLLDDLTVIHHTPRADYEYRIHLTHSAFALALARLALELDYDNFKDSVRCPKRKRAFSSIWWTLMDLARELKGVVPLGRRQYQQGTLPGCESVGLGGLNGEEQEWHEWEER